MNTPRLFLEPEEFSSTDTVRLARMLLGKTLVLEQGSSREAHLITEVEAYDGPEDKASHASRGLTPRNAVMFGPGGIWYVYLVYGIHEMLNLVTGPEGYPAAILIRGLDSVSGPGRLTRNLGLDRRFNGLPAHPDTGLFLEDPGQTVSGKSIRRTPRIGVDYAGPVWAVKPYRFLIS
jgi:DNA-3-methyladenine glycosylase